MRLTPSSPARTRVEGTRSPTRRAPRGRGGAQPVGQLGRERGRRRPVERERELRRQARARVASWSRTEVAVRGCHCGADDGRRDRATALPHRPLHRPPPPRPPARRPRRAARRARRGPRRARRPRRRRRARRAARPCTRGSARRSTCTAPAARRACAATSRCASPSRSSTGWSTPGAGSRQSANYRSAVVRGHARKVTDPDEALAAMRALVTPGRARARRTTPTRRAARRWPRRRSWRSTSPRPASRRAPGRRVTATPSPRATTGGRASSASRCA